MVPDKIRKRWDHRRRSSLGPDIIAASTPAELARDGYANPEATIAAARARCAEIRARDEE